MNAVVDEPAARTMETPFPAAVSSRLPAGISIQPRKFEFRDLDSVPQYWFGDNPILSHVENAFSILIPPGERFFIRAVREHAEQVRDPELREMVRAFVQQEGLHMRAHNELNASFAHFGVDVDREIAYAEQVFTWIERKLPKKMRLGMTAFLEHVTATGAHALFLFPEVGALMHPELRRFWRWHAVEELEHKSVAYDVFRDVGGGYVYRVASALVAVALLARPFDRIARRMIAQDPRRVTREDRRKARELNLKVLGPQLRLIARYFRPGFHPGEFDDTEYLRQWYAMPAPDER